MRESLISEPVARTMAYGAGSLTDGDLAAVLLGPTSAGARLIARDGLTATLARGAAGMHGAGMTPAAAARLAAAAELAVRLLRGRMDDRDLIADPESAADYLRARMGGDGQEVMGALLLDARNRLMGIVDTFRGSATSAVVVPAPLFRAACERGAVSIVLYHNHPSGDPSPSADDRATTQRFVDAGRALGIEVRDHIVVGRAGWVSFRRMGWMR